MTIVYFLLCSNKTATRVCVTILAMNARHAARELALLTLYQLDRQGLLATARIDRAVIEELILNAVRALVNEAEEQVESAAKDLAAVSQGLLDYEMDHPENLATAMDAPLRAVPIPTTQEMIAKIERCLQAAEWIHEACRLPEMAALSKKEDVRDYTVRVVQTVLENQTELDGKINQVSSEWRVDRMNKMDQYILRIAAAEILLMQDVDAAVAIDEAVEFAKQYSEEESFRFINGVLGGLAGKPVEA